MIQATIYHVRSYGQNIYNQDEKQKYYSEPFLNNERHYNHRVESELIEFKIEIEEKFYSNHSKFY